MRMERLIQQNFLSFRILTTNRPSNGLSAFAFFRTVSNSAKCLLKSYYTIDIFSQALSETLYKRGPSISLQQTF